METPTDETGLQVPAAPQGAEQVVLDAVRGMIRDGDIAGVMEETVTGTTEIVALGLDSLSGIELVTRIEMALGRRPSDPDLLLNALADAEDGDGTINALAESVRKALAHTVTEP